MFTQSSTVDECSEEFLPKLSHIGVSMIWWYDTLIESTETNLRSNIWTDLAVALSYGGIENIE